jgi:hypothetical protein
MPVRPDHSVPLSAGHPDASPAFPPERDLTEPRGLHLIFSMGGAALLIVVDVAVMALVAETWVLIPGVVVLLVTALLVFGDIARVLRDDGDAPPLLP